MLTFPIQHLLLAAPCSLLAAPLIVRPFAPLTDSNGQNLHGNMMITDVAPGTT